MKSHHFKHAGLPIILLLICYQAFSQAVYKYNVEKVTTDVYVLKPVIGDYRWVTANIIVVVNQGDVLVVDSGLLPAAGAEAIKEIKKITNKPVRHLVNTHWHGDHWQGNDAFVNSYPGIEIIATDQAARGIDMNGMVWAKKLYLKHLGNALKDAERDQLTTAISELKLDIEDMKIFKPVPPNVVFEDKLILKKGPREIQILYLGIGNTSGDAIVYLPNEKILVTGDLVVHPSPYESGMFSPEWLETSRKLAAFDYTTLIPGHGDVQKDHRYLNFLNDLYQEIIRQIQVAYSTGVTQVDEFKQKVTHETVAAELSKTSANAGFVKDLDPAFVTAAVQTTYKRVVQGKK